MYCYGECGHFMVGMIDDILVFVEDVERFYARHDVDNLRFLILLASVTKTCYDRRPSRVFYIGE